MQAALQFRCADGRRTANGRSAVASLSSATHPRKSARGKAPRLAGRNSRMRITLAGMQRHPDQRRAANHQIDSDQQPETLPLVPGVLV